MELRWRLFLLWGTLCISLVSPNSLPVFIQDMNNLALSESTPAGSVVYTLQGTDPKGLPIKYDLVGTDKFLVDADSGKVTLQRPLDREKEDTIKFLVSIESQNADPTQNLVQRQPVTVIVLDENDNPPMFKNSPYEIDVPEDEEVGKTVLRNIQVEDVDSVGDSLEVGCLSEQWPDACKTFEVETLNSTASQYFGRLILKKNLNYNEKQFYQFQLYATDGTLRSLAHVEVKVVDVQNSPPAFSGSLTAALSEDAPVGTLVLKLTARDQDRAQPRTVTMDLLTNPLDFFVLDGNNGELRTAKPLDREALDDPSSPLNVTVRATEIVNGAPLYTNLTSSVATVTVTIRDVNDEPPRFNRREYFVTIPESLPVGTPLPGLDMVVTDTDLGANSVFGVRVSGGVGSFTAEPQRAAGTAPVTLRLGAPLDYEDPNQRKFIIEVIAEELDTEPRLSSKASVTVTLSDVNDHAPQFPSPPYAAAVAEAAPAGTLLAVIAATDRDTGRFGTDGIVYQLSGGGAELFTVDNRTGAISVAPCDTPGLAPCLDLETRRDYFLQYKATDDDGQGQTSVVSLQISLLDSNDNPPVFDAPLYRASVDEDAVKFEPELQVQARDVDATSEIRYSIVDPPIHPFSIDALTGRLSIRSDAGGVSQNGGDKIVLTVLATDSVHNATCNVEITVRDVNNHAPVFDIDRYDADIPEDAPIGTEVAAVRATDLDSGANAEIKYGIQKGALEAFAIDNITGVVTVASKLDYDVRNTYKIQIVASDAGMPSLTGTTELTVHVANVNDKKPSFTPPVQRAEVSADAAIGTVVHQLVAVDPDIEDYDLLVYEMMADKPIKAVDRNGKELSPELAEAVRAWFNVSPRGGVVVARQISRALAAVVALPVAVTDASASALQQAEGELIINIVDVNRYAPVFSHPAYHHAIAEGQPEGTVLYTYSATDKESPIAAILIEPPSPYFQIDNVTGVVKTSQHIDYEKVHTINFTVVAYDSGVPQLSTSAAVTVDVINVNDEEPRFAAEAYDAAVAEHSGEGTRVLVVTAVDKDEGEFGEITYSLSGNLSSLFNIDPMSGVVAVASDIDRETTPDVWLRAIATDNAPPQTRRSTSVPVHIKVLDINDHSPVFSQRAYKSTIAENLRLDPPPAILQVLAEDKDEGINGKIEYSIVEQSESGAFTVDSTSGIIYPAKPVKGGSSHHLLISATDEAGRGTRQDLVTVDVTVLAVNRHSPVFVQPPQEQRQLEIPENAAEADYLIATIKATDEDSGENGRVSYYLKVDNQNVGETAEFKLDPDSGELRTKTFLDREHKAEYQLVIAAVDNGTPAQFESLRLLTVVLADDDDNSPRFQQLQYRFSILENLAPGTIVGTIRAIDKDSGDNGKVYYHILDGNKEGAFTLDRTQGIIRANMSFDREVKSEYSLTVYASNSPVVEGPIFSNIESGDPALTTVQIRILDENDNEPKFKESIYYAVVKHTARMNEPLISVVAEDPDLGENGTLNYAIAASNLYNFGATKSSGSVVPSPFNISQDGVVTTAQYMSEYQQGRFVLDIIAKELAPPHRQAKTHVYVWIIDRSSLIRMVVSRDCESIDSRGGAPFKRLQAAAQAALVTATRAPLVQADLRLLAWCDIQLLAVDPSSHQVLGVDRVLENIDSRFDELKDVYQEYGVETLIAASASSKASDNFDPALAALIALLIVLFTGIVTFIVVCACLKHWVIPPPSLQSSKGDSLARRRILDELSTTDNPLWLEAKLRPYEEQELTMDVFTDPPPDPPQSDNTYATIQGSRATERFGDYATLGGESPTPLEAALGFQGSTFKPPSPDTPEPPPRPTAGLAQL
ncbi:hypothetical protein ACJJTC_003597 [Scirpophaga incertulas]